MRASKIIIYCGTRLAKEIDVLKLTKFAADIFSVQAEHECRCIFSDARKYRSAISATRINDVKKSPVYTDKNNIYCLDAHEDDSGKQIYDGFELCQIASAIIHDEEIRTSLSSLNVKTIQSYDPLHVVFTDMIICTFDQEDYRYHARMLVGANPFLISVPGIVEGPAKSRRYYVRQMTKKFSEHMSKDAYCDAGSDAGSDAGNNNTHDSTRTTINNNDPNYDYIVRNDSRMPHIVQGLLLQAVTYYETGEAFCSDNTCRMYNAHWQSDMIRTQVTNQKLCSKHYNVIKKMQTAK